MSSLKYNKEAFSKVHGTTAKDLKKLKTLYSLCSDSLVEFLSFVDGTYYCDYGDGVTVLI